MCNLHWCYTFCTGVTLFALVLHLNCTALSQSESSNFFMYIVSMEGHIWLSSLKLLLRRKQSKTTQRLLASMDLSPWSVAGAEIRPNSLMASWRCRQNAKLWVVYSKVSWTRSAAIGVVHRAKRSRWVNVWCWFVLKLFKKERWMKNFKIDKLQTSSLSRA